MPFFWPRVAIIGGLVLTLMGAFYSIGLGLKIDTTATRFAAELLGLLVLGLLPLGLGLGSMWYGLRRCKDVRRALQTQRDAECMQYVLQRLQTHPQGVTASECALHTPYSAAEMEDTLHRCYLDGTLDIDVSEQGLLVYKRKP